MTPATPTKLPTQSAMQEALRTVPIAVRRDWNRDTNRPCVHAGCTQGLHCSAAPHYTGERLADAYTALVVDRAPGTGSPDVAALARRVEALEQARPHVTHVNVTGAPTRVIPSGTFVHAKFPEVLRCIKAGLPVMLVGPAGSGKSELAKQVAFALDRKFSFDSVTAGISEGAIMGRLLPLGENGTFTYARSAFVERYEEGGIYCAEEFDGIDPNVALIFNNALAGDTVSVSSRVGANMVKRHPDFGFIANANTFGTGADRQYVGRSQLDAATLSRFDVSTVEIDYDPVLEAAIIPAPILRWVQAVRSIIAANRLRRTCSTRTGVNAKKLSAVGDLPAQWAARYFAPWTADELAKIPANLRRGEA